MSRRLYPLTEDTELLEKIAGVPANTNNLLETISRYCNESSAKLYDVLDGTVRVDDDVKDLIVLHGQDVNKFYDFLMFGFGTFDGCGFAETAEGKTTDPAKVKILLTLNRVLEKYPNALELCNGLQWL